MSDEREMIPDAARPDLVRPDAARPDLVRPDVARLDRQVERSGVRTQRLLNRSFERLSELEAILLGLVDRLVAAEVVSEDELVAAARRVEAEAAARGEGLEHLVTLREDPAGPEPPVAMVDCAARMPVCRGVCCHLSVALSADEVESGRLRWDLGNPYRLRRESDGRCTHQVRETGFCGVYDDRPRPCRTYSCATDERIWADFAAMELNEEWLAANVTPDGPRFTPPRARETRLLRRTPPPSGSSPPTTVREP